MQNGISLSQIRNIPALQCCSDEKRLDNGKVTCPGCGEQRLARRINYMPPSDLVREYYAPGAPNLPAGIFDQSKEAATNGVIFCPNCCDYRPVTDREVAFLTPLIEAAIMAYAS